MTNAHVKVTPTVSENGELYSKTPIKVKGDEEVLDAQYEVIEGPDPNKKQKKVAKIMAGIAIGAGLAGGTLYFALHGEKNADQPTTTTGDTTGEKDNKDTNNIEVAPDVDYGNYVISPELSDDQIADQFVSNMNTVLTICMTEENEKLVGEQIDNNKDTSKRAEDFETELVKPYIDKAFVDMFGEDYMSSPDVAAFYNAAIDLAVENFDRYTTTVAGNRDSAGKVAANLPIYEYEISKNGESSKNSSGDTVIPIVQASNFYETVLARYTSETNATSPEVINNTLVIDTEKTSSSVVITDVEWVAK